MSLATLPSSSRIALMGFVVAGGIALASALLGFARIVYPMTYPQPLFWVGTYVGPAALLVAAVASILAGWRRAPTPLLAGTALYLTVYLTAETVKLSSVPYVSLSMMLVYGVAMVWSGIEWNRGRALDSAAV